MIGYTTAPKEYDGFGTRTLIPVVGYDNGKVVRKVEIDPQHRGWQEARYGSGMHALWTEDDFHKLERCGWYLPAEVK